MDAKKRTRVAILIALIMVAAVFGSFAYSLYTLRTARISLPDRQPDSSSPAPSYQDQVQRVEIEPATVQAAIASLERADSYYRQLTVRTYWPGGSGSTTSQCWVDGGYTQTRTVLPTGQVRYTLSGNGKVRSRTMLLNGKELVLGENDELPALEAVAQAAGTVELAPATCTFFVL